MWEWAIWLQLRHIVLGDFSVLARPEMGEVPLELMQVQGQIGGKVSEGDLPEPFPPLPVVLRPGNPHEILILLLCVTREPDKRAFEEPPGPKSKGC